MRVSRLFTPQVLQPGTQVSLDAEASHYLLRVLRLPVGAALLLFNGDGSEYRAELSEAGKKQAAVHVLERLAAATESPLHTVLGLGLSRGERMDYAIQKSTELGVSRIVPLFTATCEVKLDASRAGKRLAHWQQVAISAAEQCGRVQPPEVVAPQKLEEWLASPLAGLKLVCDQRQERGLPPQAPPEGVVLLIGPEGGLSEREVAQARAAGFQGLALGPRVFRTETAPVAALSVIQYLWGDLAG